MILPVAVTLKRFLALEFVFTLGMLLLVLGDTAPAVLHGQYTYGAGWAIVPKHENYFGAAKVTVNVETTKAIPCNAFHDSGKCASRPLRS